MMRRTGLFIVVLSVFTVFLMAQDKPAAKSAVVPLPGITTPDKQPHGCVDCHVNPGADGKDHRLPEELKALKVKHADVAKVVKVIPVDCGKCHKEGARAGTVAAFAHKHHLGAPTTAFIAQGGSCLSCHALDAKTGMVNVKSGAPNW